MSKNEFLNKEEAEALKAVEEAKTAKRKKSRSGKKKNAKGSGDKMIVQIMNGEFLAKENFIANLPFTFYIAFLMVVIIAWGYYSETVTKHEIVLEKELGELNSEYFTLGSEYNTKRGRRPIAEKLQYTGVKESTSSPKKIRVQKYTVH